MSTATAPIVIAAPLTPEWYEARRTGIGASEIAAVAGLSTYSTALDVYCRKRGIIPETEENDAMRLGKALEPIIKAEFTRRTGLTLEQDECPMLRHPEYPFLFATPDAIVCDGNPLECKSTSYYVAKHLGEDDSDFIPAEWNCQTQMQMAVVGRDMTHVAVLVDGRTLRPFRVDRNERLITGLIAKARELWERIEAGEPPEPDFNHSATLQLIKAMYPVNDAKRILLSPKGVAAYLGKKAVNARIRELEKERDKFDAELRVEFGDAEFADCEGHEFYLYRKEVTVSEHVRKESKSVRIYEKKAGE